MKNSFIVNFILFVTIFVTSFIVCSKSIFGAEALIPLDTGYSNFLIQNIIGGSSSVGSAPSFTSIINGYSPQLAPAIYDQINQAMYNQYGYDFDDAINDTYLNLLNINDSELGTQSELISVLTGGLYGTANELNSNGLKLGQLNTSLPSDSTDLNVNLWETFFDTYVVGTFDEVSGKITQAFDNVVYKVKDGWSEFWSPFSATNIDNMTNAPFLLTRTITFNSQSNLQYINFSFNTSVLLFKRNGEICACYPASASSSSNYFSGNCLWNSGTYSFVTPWVICTYTFDLNGVTYRVSPLYFQSTDGYGNGFIRSDVINYSEDDVKNAIRLHPDIFGSAYSYKRDLVADGVDLNSLLSGLSDKYLTKDYLESLLDIIGRANIDVYVEDGTTSNVAELDPTLVAELEALIQAINELSLSLEGEIDTMPPTVDPTPPTPPDTPTLTPLPDGYFPPIIPSLLPSEMFEMFQPVFDIVGGDNSMYGIWLLIPSILIATIILYLIVSLF